MPRIILASQSPRRRQLLAQTGLTDFEILVPQADESYDSTASPEEIVSSISRRKGEAAQALVGEPETLIIAADTMVFLDGLRLGKPKDEADAFAMLTALSGRTHHVCTGVTVCRGTRVGHPDGNYRRHLPFHIGPGKWAYIHTGDPIDKAGSYGVQGKAALFVSGIRGDYFNVMGLPLHLLGRMLKDFGLDLFAEEVGR